MRRLSWTHSASSADLGLTILVSLRRPSSLTAGLYVAKTRDQRARERIKKEEGDILNRQQELAEQDQAKMIFNRDKHPRELERALRNSSLEPAVMQTQHWKDIFGSSSTSSSTKSSGRETPASAYHTPGKKTPYFTPGKNSGAVTPRMK